MVEISKSIGSDSCPKCGSADLTKTYQLETDTLKLVCKACTYSWNVLPLDNTSETV